MYLSTQNGVAIYDSPVTPQSTPHARVVGVPGGRELFVGPNGRLFVPMRSTVAVYNSPVLASKGPAFTLRSPQGPPEDVGEDPDGDVYVSVPACCIEVFDAPLSRDVAPSWTISPGAPYGIAFDQSGDLYASGETSIVRYATTITPLSTPAAQVTLFQNGHNFGGLVVDAAGRVFVANATAQGTVDVYEPPLTSQSPRSFALSVATTPVTQIAFDGSGNLWAVDSTGDVWMFRAPIGPSSAKGKVLSVRGAYGIAFGP